MFCVIETVDQKLTINKKSTILALCLWNLIIISLRTHEAAVFTKFHRIMTKNVDFFIIGRFLITVANFG